MTTVAARHKTIPDDKVSLFMLILGPRESGGEILSQFHEGRSLNLIAVIERRSFAETSSS